MRRSTVLISGAGQLGSRHLQGMAASTCPLDIHVHDISADSLRASKARWDEVTDRKACHRVFLHDAFDALPRHIDAAVIATTAHVRPRVIEEIVKHTHVDNWILEKVLARNEGALEKICSSIGNSQKAWVNLPRRSMPWHRDMKATLAHDRPMTLIVDGCNWGLACNAIHFLDMFSWWTDEALIEVSADRLDSNWIEAKRAGNMEVTGTLDAWFSGGSHAQLTVRLGDMFYAFECNDGSHVWKMDELAGTAVRSDGLSLPGRVPYQSEMSGLLIDTLLKDGECALPSLEQSAQIHRLFLRALLKHWQGHVDSSAIEVPIT